MESNGTRTKKNYYTELWNKFLTVEKYVINEEIVIIYILLKYQQDQKVEST